MATFSRDKTKGRIRKILVSCVGTLILVLFIFPLIFRGFASRTGFVLWQTGNHFANAIDGTRTFFIRNEALRKENELLKSQLKDATIKNTLPVSALAENTEDAKSIVLPVIAKPFKTGSDTMVLLHTLPNAEQYLGTIVTTTDGIPVGFVTQIVGRSLYVKLFSYSGNKITLREKDSAIDFDLVGRAGGNFYLQTNPDVPVTLGAFLYLPGISAYPVARVAKVVSRDHDPEKIYLATLVINYNNLDSLKLTEVPYVISN